MKFVLVELALTYLSWALLYLGLPRYYPLHGGMLPRIGLATRCAGWLLACAALAFGVSRQGWGIGTVTWASAWMLSAIGWVLLQPYRPRLARRLVPVLLGLAVIFYLAP